MELVETAQLANVAAGLEVERLGVAPVEWHEIQKEIAGQTGKIVTLDEMVLLADTYRRQQRRIVLVNGCFDLLHVGHVHHLQEAAEFGDVLIVAINSDASARRLKGPTRPVIGQDERARMLAALSEVDHVLVFEEDTPHELLRRIRPHFLIKGGTYSHAEVVGAEVVEAYGGSVCVTEEVLRTFPPVRLLPP